MESSDNPASEEPLKILGGEVVQGKILFIKFRNLPTFMLIAYNLMTRYSF